VCIISLLTQDPSEGVGAMPGKASLHNVNHALKALARLIAEEMLTTSLALPRLAKGVGGLDCAKVRPLIDKHLERLDIFVIIYMTYRKGLRADEKLAHCA
jgi:O-acetyl-ADP-ribose deacetylase (regulator of RNase III)